MKNFIIEHYKRNSYPVDKLILVGIRNSTNSGYDMFNDYLLTIYNDNLMVAKGTTDPGIYYTKNPLNTNGAFHLNLGFHKNIWRIRKHKGKYLALCNDSKCNRTKGWRDKNKNFENDDKIKINDWVGINWHYSTSKEFILYSSAGCQVTPDIRFFNNSVECAIASEQEFFSYMLFNIEEIPTNLIVDIEKQIEERVL